MFKWFAFAALVAVASAAPAPGYLGAPGLVAANPWGYGAPGLVGNPWGYGHGGVIGAPLIGAPVVKSLPVATSYANTIRVASPAVAYAAPVAHAPLVSSPYLAHGLAGPALAHGW